MTDSLPGDVTRFLQRIEDGERDAFAELLPIVYRELHALARAQMRSQRAGHTLQPTALVNEAYLALSGEGSSKHWVDRRHFFRAAATVMRSILVNHARARGRQKRGGGAARVAHYDPIDPNNRDPLDLIALDEALHKLESIETRQAAVIELRFFAGLTIAETASVLELSERTVQGDWSLSRAWLLREMDGKPGANQD